MRRSSQSQLQLYARQHKATEGDAKEFGATSTNPFKTFVEAWLKVLCVSSLTLQEEAHTGCSYCSQLRFPNFIEPFHKDRQRLSRIKLFLVSPFVSQILLKRRLHCTASETRRRTNDTLSNHLGNVHGFQDLFHNFPCVSVHSCSDTAATMPKKQAKSHTRLK